MLITKHLKIGLSRQELKKILSIYNYHREVLDESLYPADKNAILSYLPIIIPFHWRRKIKGMVIVDLTDGYIVYHDDILPCINKLFSVKAFW